MRVTVVLIENHRYEQVGTKGINLIEKLSRPIVFSTLSFYVHVQKYFHLSQLQSAEGEPH